MRGALRRLLDYAWGTIVLILGLLMIALISMLPPCRVKDKRG